MHGQPYLSVCVYTIREQPDGQAMQLATASAEFRSAGKSMRATNVFATVSMAHAKLVHLRGQW